MLRTICCALLFTCGLGATAQTDAPAPAACCAAHKPAGKALSCSLTTEEYQKRKETVLASLKTQVLERAELPDGYAYSFEGSDKVIDELTEFIKTERTCCAFLSFNLAVSGDKKIARLELTGPEGAKEVIREELDL